MSKRHPGTWNNPPGKEDIRPAKLDRIELVCDVCGSTRGNKSRYMDNAMGQRVSVRVCSNTCFANWIEKQACIKRSS